MNTEEARKYFIKDRFAMITTGIEIDEARDNYSRCSLKIDDRHLAVNDHVMGGATYTLADFAFAVATNSADNLTMTASSTISYLGQPKDGQLIAECRCIKNGRTTCCFETTVTDGIGTLVAHVTVNGIHIQPHK